MRWCLIHGPFTIDEPFEAHISQFGKSEQIFVFWFLFTGFPSADCRLCLFETLGELNLILSTTQPDLFNSTSKLIFHDVYSSLSKVSFISKLRTAGFGTP